MLPLSEWMGHNRGPDWDDILFLEYCWRRAWEKAWTPPQETVVRRARRAAAIGVSYRRYALEILERGRYLDEETAQEFRASKSADTC